MKLQNYTNEELEAIKENTNAEGDAGGVLIIQGILDSREAEAYAHEDNDEAYTDSTGTLT